MRSGGAEWKALQIGIADGMDLGTSSDTEPLTTEATGGSHAFILGAGPEQSFRGAFGELLIYDRVLSSSESDAIMAYLLAKWVD